MTPCQRFEGLSKITIFITPPVLIIFNGRVNLSTVVLQMMTMGITDVIHFDFMDPPPKESLKRAMEELYALGALNETLQVTDMGRKMAVFPVDPKFSKCILAAEVRILS